MKNSYAFLVLIIIIALTSSVSAQQEYDYEQVLGLSIWFYEAQRCGKLPITNRVDWRWDSFVDDGSDISLDLEGGYFDAGDHVKFGFPLAGSITILAWGVLDYTDGYLAAGEYENGLDMLEWGLDYMIKTHPEPNVIWVNVGNGTVDHSFWGRPEEWPQNLARPSVGPINITHPGSDLAGEYAAAFAASSLVFRTVNTTYSKVLLRHAIECYDFAFNYRGRYSDNVYKSPEYGSWAYEDELLWASVWLYRATTDPVYLTNARSLWDEHYLGYTPQGFGWDDKLAGAQILLARFAGRNEPEYVTAAENFCRWVRNDARKTPLGLIFLSEWGSLRSISTVVFACLQAAEINIDTEANRAMAVSQIGYALGDTGRSFVVGFGVDPPSRPHHRASSCPSLPLPCNGDEALNNPGPNPQTLFGALVGGPGLDDSYVDDRQDYVKNEVALDYNAGFQSAIAGMISLRNRGLL